MKIILFAVAFFATSVYGQKTDYKNVIDTFPGNYGLLGPDTSLRVFHADKKAVGQRPAIFINGKFMINQLTSAINPNFIHSVDVIKRDTLIEDILYVGQVYIQMKKEYAPAFITLTELIEKYTDLKDQSVIFTIDGNFVNEDYDRYLIDERSMLSLFIDTMKMDNQKLHVGLVKILTKTDANIRDRNHIMIKGVDLTKN